MSLFQISSQTLGISFLFKNVYFIAFDNEHCAQIIWDYIVERMHKAFNRTFESDFYRNFMTRRQLISKMLQCKIPLIRQIIIFGRKSSCLQIELLDRKTNRPESNKRFFLLMIYNPNANEQKNRNDDDIVDGTIVKSENCRQKKFYPHTHISIVWLASSCLLDCSCAGEHYLTF